MMTNYTIENHLAKLSTQDYIKEYRDQHKFIKYCKACPSYQNSWACPPFEDDPITQILHYPYTYIIGTQIHFKNKFVQESKSGDIEQISRRVMKEVRAILDPKLLKLEQRQAPSLAFYAGNCHLCLDLGCTKGENRPCRYPNLIRPSLEACGFDIAKSTSEALGLELKWGKDGALPPYFILVSGLMSTRELSRSEIMTTISF